MIAHQDPDGPDSAARTRAAIRGDRAAIAALWAEHRRWIAAVILTYKPREADLEDLLQEVAMRLIGHIQTLREESNLRAWLRAVAVNVARSAGRASRTSRVTSSDALDQIGVLDAPASPGDGGPGDVESDGSIMSLVEALPDLYREPLILRAVHGMRTRQIAVVLDLPPATIDTRIARARRMLRDRQLTGGHTS